MLPSRCLTCQLHAAVVQNGILRNIPQRCRAFTTYRARLQEAEQWQRNKREEGYRWRSIALLDEKHCKRKKPVIILEDTPKGKDKSRNSPRHARRSVDEGILDQEQGGHPPSARQIESVVQETHTVPVQADVNASIEAMRKEATSNSTVMDISKFESLVQDLTKSYTVHQLGRYLGRSIPTPSHRVRELHLSPWRSGRTPLAKRPKKETAKKGPSTKEKIAKQILRLVWEVTVESEENEDGELEIELKPWQLSLLFDLQNNGNRYLDGLVTPQSLVHNSDIQTYRPENIMRITGRRQTAEEIARQLQLALLKVHHLSWDLRPLVSSPRNPAVTVGQLFRKQDISYVAQLTESVIVSEDDGVIAIYSTTRLGVFNARRLLLALLDQSYASFDGVSRSTDAGPTSDLPIGNSTAGVQRRYHGLELLRKVKAQDATKAGTNNNVQQAQASVDELATSVAKQLDAVESLRQYNASVEHTGSYWRAQIPGRFDVWKARFCTLLHTASTDQILAGSIDSSAQSKNIVQHTVPGLETLLSYFESSKSPEVAKTACQDFAAGHMLPFIKAHFKPSSKDLNPRTILPRLEMRFHFNGVKTDTGPRELRLTGLWAVVDEQRLSVPLPDQATDLQFVRRSKLSAQVDAAELDANILQFVRQVQKSARNNKGALTAPAELSVKLPSWLVEHKGSGNTDAGQDVPVKYLFERFEQIQKMEFVPRRHEGIKLTDDNRWLMLADLPQHLRLEYREVDGGAIYGNSTVLSLGLGQAQRIENSITTEEQKLEKAPGTPCNGPSSELASAALRIAHLLTCANSGSLERHGEEEEGEKE